MPTALITGASSGIGLELAKLLAQKNYALVLTGRNTQALSMLEAECKSLGSSNVISIPIDLANPSGVQSLCAEIETRNIQIDLLINNAGFGNHGPFAQAKLGSELDLLQVNVVSLVELTHKILPQMIARNSGKILNVASTAAFQPGPLMANYYASKAYVLNFSDALCDELRNSGITVTTLCPGPTLTQFQTRAGIANSKLFSVAGLTAKQVAEQGLNATLAGQARCIPGLKNKLLVFSVRFLPRQLVMSVVRKLNESR